MRKRRDFRKNCPDDYSPIIPIQKSPINYRRPCRHTATSPFLLRRDKGALPTPQLSLRIRANLKASLNLNLNPHLNLHLNFSHSLRIRLKPNHSPQLQSNPHNLSSLVRSRCKKQLFVHLWTTRSQWRMESSQAPHCLTQAWSVRGSLILGFLQVKRSTVQAPLKRKKTTCPLLSQSKENESLMWLRLGLERITTILTSQLQSQLQFQHLRPGHQLLKPNPG